MATAKQQIILPPSLLDKTISNNNLDLEYYLEKQREIIAKELRRVAESEVRETYSTRKECLEIFRKWIEQNPDVENCLTDDNFLLRFLRAKKYSIPMAQQILLKYLNYRKRFPELMCNLDYTEKNVSELIISGFIFVSPFRDQHGRRIIIYDTTKFDPQKYTGIDLGRVHAITYETLMEDEQNQILGITHVANVGGVNSSFVTLFPVAEWATLIRWGEQSYPMRHKDANIINMPQALKFIYDFVKSHLSQKLRDRISIFDSIPTLSNKLDMRCLPKEWGGEMTTKDMIESWKKELEAKKPRLLSYDSMKLLSDKGIIRRRDAKGDDTGNGSLPGSFRKLELD